MPAFVLPVDLPLPRPAKHSLCVAAQCVDLPLQCRAGPCSAFAAPRQAKHSRAFAGRCVTELCLCFAGRYMAPLRYAFAGPCGAMRCRRHAIHRCAMPLLRSSVLCHTSPLQCDTMDCLAFALQGHALPLPCGATRYLALPLRCFARLYSASPLLNALYCTIKTPVTAIAPLAEATLPPITKPFLEQSRGQHFIF
jgi:hypothetical protein